MLITASFIVLFVLLSSLSLYAGRKRRVGDEPHCRGCNYLLHGLQSQQCPECGLTLSPDAIVHGEPRRRLSFWIAGWLALLLLAALLFTGTISQLRTIDWYHYRPTFMVFKDLNSVYPSDVQAAWTELLRRDAAGSLSATSRAAMVVYALARQQNAQPPYNSLDLDTINYLGSRCLAKNLPAQQRTQFFEQSVRMKLKVRPIVIAGDMVPYLAEHKGLGPNKGDFLTKLTSQSVAVDGREVEGASGGYSSYTGFGSGSVGSEAPARSPGKHELGVTFRIEIFTVSPTGSRALLYQNDPTMTGNFEVIATKPANPVHAIYDPKLAATMNAAISPGEFDFYAKTHSFGGAINFKNPPVDIADDLIARYAGSEHRLGAITHKANSGYSSWSTTAILNDPPPATVDIILRPSEAAARNTADIYTYWNQEMVFPNILVKPR